MLASVHGYAVEGVFMDVTICMWGIAFICSSFNSDSNAALFFMDDHC